MSLLANCPHCTSTFRVPHDRKKWRCKECDSFLEIEVVEPDNRTYGAADDCGETCGACEAVNFGEGAFCEECGAPLAEGAPARSGLTRLEAAGDMRKTMKRIGRLKTWLGLNLLLSLMGTAIFVSYLWSAENLSGTFVAIACAIQLVTLGLAYAAYHFVDRKPLPIVLGLASLQTLNTIWNFMDGAMWIPSFVWALLLWWLATDAAHAAKLAADHPELYSSKRMRGEHLTRNKSGRSGSADTNWWILGGVTAAALALGVAAFRVSKKSSDADVGGGRVAQEAPTTSPREATEAFRRAWNSHDIDALGQLTKESLREKMKASLQRIGQRYEWGTEFPQLEAAVFTEPKTGNVRVIFPSEAGEFPVRFVVEDGDWVIRTIKTSPLKAWRP